MNKYDKAKAEAVRLRAEGASIEQIVESTGLDTQEVVDAIAEAGEELVTLQGVKQEAALISFGVTRKERLKKLTALRDKLEEEMDKRDFSDIPTEKLPALLLKVNEAIREEVTPPRIISSPIFNSWDKDDRGRKAIADI